jgi:transposase-like protein
VKKMTLEELVAAQSDLLRDKFIVDLALAGIPQAQIARIVRVDLNRVNRIAKQLRRTKKKFTAALAQ